MTPTPLNVTVPEEPPDGSVFLDRLHRAWQRNGPVWYMAGTIRPLFGGGQMVGLRWGQLLLDCGEGIVLWSPTAADTAAAAAAEQTIAEGIAAAAATLGTVVHIGPDVAEADGKLLGFTRHGHPVGSTTVPDGTPRPPLTAKCGGPAICSECGRDAAVIKELNDA
jgi:hypothetical protein